MILHSSRSWNQQSLFLIWSFFRPVSNHSFSPTCYPPLNVNACHRSSIFPRKTPTIDFSFTRNLSTNRQSLAIPLMHNPQPTVDSFNFQPSISGRYGFSFHQYTQPTEKKSLVFIAPFLRQPSIPTIPCRQSSAVIAPFPNRQSYAAKAPSSDRLSASVDSLPPLFLLWTIC